MAFHMQLSLKFWTPTHHTRHLTVALRGEYKRHKPRQNLITISKSIKIHTRYIWEQQKKLCITESTPCMRATKETGYYWECIVYESNKRNWVLLTAHCIWEQQKKLGITDSTLCMRATKESGYYWEHTVYDSNKRNLVLLRVHRVQEQ